MPVLESLASKPGTQKAAGIKALSTRRSDHGLKVPPAFLVQCEKDIAAAINWAASMSLPVDLTGTQRCFARPCPPKPRHGFVESRLLSVTAESIGDLLAEAILAEAGSELLLMPPIGAVCSAILTRVGLAVGPGHAGATGGDGSFLLPLAGANFPAPLLAAAGITLANDSQPYMELVVGTENVWAVQLRGGHALAPVDDWVPADVTVSEILNPADYSELAWESLCATYRDGTKDKTGVVVWAPGSTMLCHAANHACPAGLAYFTKTQPSVGQTFAPTVAETTPAWTAFVRGIQAGMMVDCLDPSHLATAITLAHHATTLVGSSAWAMGAACAVILRHGVAACLGERRHAKIPGKAKTKLNRQQIFAKCLPSMDAFIEARRDLVGAHTDFRTPGIWGGSMGGSPWARCAEATKNLDDALRAVCRTGLITTEPATQSKTQLVGACISALHQVVNVGHNTGPFLNKWVDVAHFNAAANGDIKLLAKAVPTLWQWWAIKSAFGLPRNESPICQRVARMHSLKFEKHVELTPGAMPPKAKGLSTGSLTKPAHMEPYVQATGTPSAAETYLATETVEGYILTKACKLGIAKYYVAVTSAVGTAIAGNKIAAIKYVRVKYNLGLLEAKLAVDWYLAGNQLGVNWMDIASIPYPHIDATAKAATLESAAQSHDDAALPSDAESTESPSPTPGYKSMVYAKPSETLPGGKVQLHIQACWVNSDGIVGQAYAKTDVVVPFAVAYALAACQQVYSMAGSTTVYHRLRYVRTNPHTHGVMVDGKFYPLVSVVGSPSIGQVPGIESHV